MLLPVIGDRIFDVSSWPSRLVSFQPTLSMVPAVTKRWAMRRYAQSSL